MGFPLKHIINAINVTKSSGEVSAHTINILASWMLEHPYTEATEERLSTKSSKVLSEITLPVPVQLVRNVV